MPTINQLVRKGRRRAKQQSKSRALTACPQRRGVCAAILMNPNYRKESERIVQASGAPLELFEIGQ